MHNYPQIVTQISDTDNKITTVIDAPWVSVTSINGMTGDVTVDAQIKSFKPNHYYLKDSAITYNGRLYFAKQTFTSTANFNTSDWTTPDITQQQADWTENDNTKPTFILNKPALSAVSTSGSYNDLSDTPNLASVALSGSYDDLSDTPSINDGQLIIQQNGQTKGSFTANQAGNTSINILTPTKTSELTNDSGFLTTMNNFEVFDSNVCPAEDTPASWINLLGNGRKWLWYNTLNVIPNQPSQYGQMEVVINGNNNLLQIWHSQPAGDIFYRAGNLTGWYNNATSPSTWRRILDDNQINMITYEMMNWDTMGPVWSTFVNKTVHTGNEQYYDFTTKKGRNLTIKVANGGSWLHVYSGGENIRMIRGAVTIQLGTSIAGSFGLGGLAPNTTMWCRSFGSASNGTVTNQAQTSETTGTVTYTNLLASTGNRTNVSYEYTAIRELNNQWRVFGKISCAGTHSTLSFEAQCNATDTGTTPTIYQRGASSSNTASTYGVLEILED